MVGDVSSMVVEEELERESMLFEIALSPEVGVHILAVDTIVGLRLVDVAHIRRRCEPHPHLRVARMGKLLSIRSQALLQARSNNRSRRDDAIVPHFAKGLEKSQPGGDDRPLTHELR